MNKLVVKEVKTKKKCQHSKGCDNQANDILKLKGFKKIYLCSDCLIQFYKELFEQFCKTNIAVGKAIKKAGGNDGKDE